MNPLTKIAAVVRFGKQFGCADTLCCIVRKIRFPRTTRLFLVALSSPRDLPKARAAAANHTFRFATPQDIMRFSQDHRHPLYETDPTTIETGHASCLLQLDGDKLVGFSWIDNSSLVFIDPGNFGHYINLPEDTVYNFRGYTAPDYRGLGFQPLRHVEMLKTIKALGKQRLFGFVNHTNFSSLRGVIKSGYVVVGEIRYQRKLKQTTLLLKTSPGFSPTRREISYLSVTPPHEE